MLAREIMSREVITVGVDASIVDAVNIMLAHHVSCLPVVDSTGKLVGILSEGDFIRRAEIGTQRKRGRWLTILAGADRVALDFARAHGRTVGQIMTLDPVTIAEDMPLEQIVAIMEARNLKRLPVLRGADIVGMVTRSDFLPVIARLASRPHISSGDDEQIRNAVLAEIACTPWRPSALNVSVRDGTVTLKGTVRSNKARQAAIIAAENVPGVKTVADHLCEVAHPPSEEDYGGGDFVSLQEEPSTEDDQPL
jgi:CBS domain-containing protein